MTVSQPCPGRVLRATVTFALRTVRRAARILRDLHCGQMRTWEIIWQAQPSGAGCENRPSSMGPDA
jgi:hypothetical protein